MNNKVIYTCVVGNIDQLVNPKQKVDGWDYICFSNDLVVNSKNSDWQIIPIPYTHSNKRRLSRYVKLLPHHVLQKYEYSLWIDANIQIVDTDFFFRIDELIKMNCEIALFPHYLRNCIYKEAEVCISLGKDSVLNIMPFLNKLENEGYPQNNGLFENGVMLRNHNNEKISRLNNEWWNIYLNYSERDQLSLVYLFWKYGINCLPIYPKGNSVRNTPFFMIESHNIGIYKKFKTLYWKIFNRIILRFIIR